MAFIECSLCARYPGKHFTYFMHEISPFAERSIKAQGVTQPISDRCEVSIWVLFTNILTTSLFCLLNIYSFDFCTWSVTSILQNRVCDGLNCVPLKFVCGRPDSWHLRNVTLLRNGVSADDISLDEVVQE